MVVIIIAGIAHFELGFDKHYNNSQNIYRIQNNRIYSKLEDRSAGCPPATAPSIKQEISGVSEATRIRPLFNCVLDITKNGIPNPFNETGIYYAESSFFKIFNQDFLLGNPTEALKEVNTAVITESFAEKHFESKDVLGESFTCNSEEGEVKLRIVGIIKDVRPDSYFQFNCLISYLTLIEHNTDAQYSWGWNAFNTFVLVEPTASIAHIEQQLEELVTKYQLSRDEMKRVFTLQALTDIHLNSKLRHEIGVRGNLFSLKVLMAIALFILCVAWINYINISSAKSKKELMEAEMKAIFGNKKSLRFIESIFDSVLLNTIGLIVSIVLLQVLSAELNQLFQISLPKIPLSKWILLIACTYLIAIISGLIPAFYLERSFTFKRKAKANANQRYLGVRNALVVFQFTVSSIFIITTLLVLQQIMFMDKKQEKLNLKNIATISSLNSSKDLQKAQSTFMQELSRIPEIEFVSTSSSIPGGNYSNVIGGIRPIGVDLDKGIKCHFIDVSENYFKLYNIKLLAGRTFYSNTTNPHNSVIVNRKAALMLGYEKPSEIIDKEIVMEEFFGQKRTIIGVVEDFNHQTLDEPIQPLIYHYKKSGQYISIKHNAPLSADVTQKIKSIWNTYCPQQAFELQNNDQYYALKYAKHKKFSKLSSTFALLIILISSIGLYSLALFSISSRTKEIGIRKANGAKTHEIVSMLNKTFIRWVVLSFAIACPIAWYIINQWLQSFAYRTQISWWIFFLAAGITIGIALLTVSWQSWKAAKKNPVVSLRYE
jgi:putative ABC transport system permease protein